MKKAFTLIEIIVAVFIFSIIMIYMYDLLAITKNSSVSYEKIYIKDKKSQNLKRIFYNDIFNQTDPYKYTKIKSNQHFSTYMLRTKNSLHDLANPYVSYKVIKGNLYRFECVRAFKFPINEEMKDKIFIDKLASKINSFLVYEYKNSKLISYEIDGKKNIFEIALPYNKKIILVH